MKYLGAALAVPVLVRHDWLVLMVIGFVAHGDFLFPDSPSELALREVDSGERRRSLVLEYLAHVVQEPCGTGQEGRPLGVIHVVQEILGILIALFRRQREPVDSGIFVLEDILSQEVQLAEGILGILVSLFCRGSKLADGLLNISGDSLALEQELAQLILGELISSFCRLLEPPKGGRGISRFQIQLSESVHGVFVALLRRLREPDYCLDGAVFHNAAIPV